MNILCKALLVVVALWYGGQTAADQQSAAPRTPDWQRGYATCMHLPILFGGASYFMPDALRRSLEKGEATAQNELTRVQMMWDDAARILVAGLAETEEYKRGFIACIADRECGKPGVAGGTIPLERISEVMLCVGIHGARGDSGCTNALAYDCFVKAFTSDRPTSLQELIPKGQAGIAGTCDYNCGRVARFWRCAADAANKQHRKGEPLCPAYNKPAVS